MILEGNLILKDRIIYGKVDFSSGKIVDIKILKDREDYSDKLYIGPGLFDSHIHGLAGYDFSEDNFSIEDFSNRLLKCGVTRFLITIKTSSYDNIYKRIKYFYENREKFTGSKPLGVFLEGPFISSSYSGSQEGKYIKKPDPSFILDLYKEFGSFINKVLLAPELEGSEEFTKILKDKKINVSLGHSGSNYSDAKTCKDLGASILNHTFNAMRPYKNRDPGILGLILEDNIYPELIYDRNHVDIISAKLLTRLNPNTFLISDSIKTLFLPDGNYKFGGLDVVKKNGKSLLKNGKLAGSNLKLLDGVKNIYEDGIKSLNDAFYMASGMALKAHGFDDFLGLKKGNFADIIVFDKNFNLKKVYVEGF